MLTSHCPRYFHMFPIAMCKSSTLAFVLIFAFIFKLEKPRLALIGIILIISTGVLLMVTNETDFVFAGFAEVMTASVLGGLRWSLTQILLERESLGMNNPIASIFFLAPLMAAALFLTSGIVEGFHNIFWNSFFVTTAEGLHTFGVILVGGCLAFLMVMSEFFLISRTSVITLSVCGIFKEVATILISSLTFGDILTPINIAGLCITLLGIGAYNYLKIQQARRSDDPRAGTEVRLSADEEGRPRPSMHVYSMVAESTPMLLLDGGMMGAYEDDEDEDDEMEGGGAEREALEMM
ncbi:hypothetical protein BC937DRAFT_90743 [Endogone sp. FLAS-F59071]|nr:hypothetical protein BC937DRAFT_90743 [Endogone sp. FLAS-F59071]|eukprot:RUS21983.1 hypothetical protein BC937DRAFT_90743 [Endogone sp. FLAS-F59071]